MAENTISQRISVVDSLRGFAVVGIILIHFLEHLNFYAFPEPTAFDQGVWDTVFFLGASKMYGIFALLFGFSCYIQHHNAEKRGEDFRGRFAWRMVLLFLWGMLDLMFFNGDILCTYAVIGLLLIPLVKASDKVLAIVALVLMFQPIEVVYLIMGLFDPSTKPMDVGLDPLWGVIYDACKDGGFWDVAMADWKTGLQINFGWALEHGRLTQTLMLFVTGMLLGRKRLFLDEGNNMQTWKRVLWLSVMAFVSTQLMMTLPDGIEAPAVKSSMAILITAWRNLSMMAFYVAGITLLYYRTRTMAAINHLSYIGKMSLTDYLLQSIVGGFLFYNWGLGLYSVCCHHISFLMGIGFCVVLYCFCRWWTTHHRRGPLEELWARTTWIGTNHK